MFPLRDHNPSNSFPIVTHGLIIINVLVFLFMFSLGEPTLESLIYSFSFIPNKIIQGQDIFTLLTSMFMHGSLGHIIGNMMFLHIFGDNLEDRLGHIHYFLFYLLCGVAASGLQIFVDPYSPIPNLGASGAIAGLMGGYLVLFPRHKIDVLLPIGFFYTATVPAFTMLFYWIVIQFFSGLGSLATQVGGIAYFAHIGGFLAGVFGIFVFPKKKSVSYLDN